MDRLLHNLWDDDAGALLATEWIFIATILVIGLTVGLTAIRSALLNEMEEFAGALGGLSQSYSFGGSTGCCAFTNGSFFTDQRSEFPVDACTDTTETTGVACPD